EAGSRPQEVARAKAELAEAEAAADNARRTFTRQKELARRDTASQQALDDARGALNRADARAAAARESLALMVAGPRKEDIAAARAQLAADHATVSLIHRRLQDATLAAPADGVILTRAREPGAVLLPTSTVYSMALTTPVWVRTYVSESDLGRVHPGMAATVTTDSAPDHAYTGQIGFISPVAEFTPKTVETPELRTSLVYRLRVVVENPDEGLRQGMPVTVTLDTGGAG
ncbi:MAG TPA: efflux RND transporter periplasmic adaptor subunit, partial [Alphaproteobacteria bacterium]|nr:efflux RND transporter periplasmic adaptor subunit [Alphaproteobacteria bacterium]